MSCLTATTLVRTVLASKGSDEFQGSKSKANGDLVLASPQIKLSSILPAAPNGSQSHKRCKLAACSHPELLISVPTQQTKPC
jgi:hypothetical protein